MDRPTPPRDPQGRQRAGYLKLRAVLWDRTTGLPAFPVLIDRLRSALDQRRRIGVVHLEAVNLAAVESLYGWQVSDRIRTRVADLLRASIGRELPPATELALGAVAGDRFIAFVHEQPDGAEADGRFLAEAGRALRAAVERGFSGDEFVGLSPPLEFACGHALLSESPFHRFERRVYAALDEARAYDERRREHRDRSRDEELRRVIRDTAIRTVFQAVVDLRSRDVLGFEAFSRGPENSPFEAPNEMFACSDRLGVSAELDRACRSAALRAWGGHAGQGKIFLNVRPGAGALAGLDTAAAARGDVILEFSERLADADPEKFAELLSRLKGHGYGVALDDIGTGYGSQAVLERVRPDFLKLDISLVREIHRNRIKQELLRSLIRIAEEIGASVIAEGVESHDELDTLLAAGARYGQGYLFAVPTADPFDGLGPGGH